MDPEHKRSQNLETFSNPLYSSYTNREFKNA